MCDEGGRAGRSTDKGTGNEIVKAGASICSEEDHRSKNRCARADGGKPAEP